LTAPAKKTSGSVADLLADLSLSAVTMAILASLAATPARAAPNLPLDDPDWIALRDARARGLLPDLLGGIHVLGEDEVAQALSAAGLPPDPLLLPAAPGGPAGARDGVRDGWPGGFWVRPTERVTLRGLALGEHDRPYSLPVKPRSLAGDVGFSCEYQEGPPCGGGLGLIGEIDSSAGLGSVLSATVRARLDLGNNGYAALAALDRAYLKAQIGVLALEAGRDVLALGPSFRGGLLWSSNGAPIDQLRASIRPFALPFVDGDALRVSLLYFIARLRQPQGRDGALIDCARIQLDLFDRVELGASRLLMFGGDGAPNVSFSDLVYLHVHPMKYVSGQPLGDNRVSFDAAVSVPQLAGARVYLEIAFEDFRHKFLNVLQFDTDYLVGLELRALSMGPLRRIFAEVGTTGRVAEESPEWRTGFSSAGRPFGTPLGPEGESVYLRAELEAPGVRVAPWGEWLRLKSDTYVSNGDGAGGVRVASVGPSENRQRLGVDVALPLSPALSLNVTAYAERVGNADLVPGSTILNGGLVTALRYMPRF
jgi:Capsule assembly protein Wzi